MQTTDAATTYVDDLVTFPRYLATMTVPTEKSVGASTPLALLEVLLESTGINLSREEPSKTGSTVTNLDSPA